MHQDPGYSADFVVVGAGLVGLCAAWGLARGGAEVTVVEATGVAAGASGRNSGAVEHPYDPVQEALYEDSLPLLRELGVPLGEHPAGVLMLDPEPAAPRALAAEYGDAYPSLTPAVLDPAQVRELEPGVAPDLWGVRLETGFPVPPAEATRRAAEAATAAGARRRTGAPATLVPGGVRAGGVLIAARTVLVAAGAATGSLAGVPVSGTWGVTLQLELADAPVHCLKDSTVTSAQAGAPIPTAFSLIGTAGTYVLGSTFLDDEPRPEDWEQRLRARGARYVPGVEQARVIQRRACARPRSPDGRPLLGPVADGVWVATGHGGRGISTGAASGLLVARALLAGDAGLIPPALRAAR